MSRLLWSLQVLLALVFLFAGGIKLATPPDVLATFLPLPEAFVRFIGLAECLGAIGLVVPGLLKIRPSLTPLAAAGLVVIMAGATLLTPLMGEDVASASLPLVLGLLAGFVAYGRIRLAPIHPSTPRRILSHGVN
jgi:hypothetical protein